MRIERVVIENINSLAGRFEVDFTDRGYSGGLFAIVGPSGAGKTTVLDAVCLALYGKTPRIDTVSMTQDELMTKGMSSCAAEAVFVSRGRRYKAVFAHRRSNGSNPFRAAERAIVEYTDHGPETIASSISDANAKIIEVTGLDYTRFTRSILLAQFRFAEFLKASANERAEILEQVTDMDIYRRISAAVYERAVYEKKTLDQIQMEIGALAVFDDETQRILEKELERLSVEIIHHIKLKDSFVSCRDAMRRIQKLSGELARCEEDDVTLREAAEKADRQFKQAEAEEKHARRAQSELQQILKTVRELDGKIAEQKRNIARISYDIDDDGKKVVECKKTIWTLFKKYMPTGDDAQMRNAYESEDVAAILQRETKEELSRVEAEGNEVRAEIVRILQGHDEGWWRACTDALRIALPMAEAKEAAAQAVEKLKIEQRLRSALKNREEALKANIKEAESRYLFAKLQEQFGEERRDLEDGKPCPLCGATEHPAAHEVLDAIYLDEAYRVKKELEEQRARLMQEITDNNKAIADLSQAIEEKRQIIQQKSVELSVLNTDIPLPDDASALKDALGNAEEVRNQHMVLGTKLVSISGQITTLTQKLSDVEKDVLSIENSHNAIREIGQRIEKNRTDKSAAQELSERFTAERQQLFGQKNVDEEEQKADQLVEDKKKAMETCRESKEKAGNAALQNRRDITRIKESIGAETNTLAPVYMQAVGTLNGVLDMSSEDEDTRVVIEKLRISAKGMGSEPNESVMHDIVGHLSALVTRETTRGGAIGQMLEDDRRNIKKREQLVQKEKKQAKVYTKWWQLDKLIGSREGDKFSRMAQGITFDALLRYANISLSRMTDQYILVRDTAGGSKPLELAVLDMYRAGEQRPVSNLSGGESFLVSLALALGLSEMSSGRARIDSLFIDEGFASLDENYLEAALQTLSTLSSREGKLVGVISHVEALKERIDAQIEVKKLLRGRSTLSGPGVTAQEA